MSAGLDERLEAALAGHAALKRIGEPEDIADAAPWLGTDASRFVAGQTILVNGGFTTPGLR